MSNNKISGKLPDLSLLSSLDVLNLSGNKQTSTLPPLPKGLVMVSLSKNSFSGEIPKQYGQLHGLQHLDLSSNMLTGITQASLFSLPNISHLNLASNQLTGPLPDHLRCGTKLEFVDISNNRPTGGLPSCLSSTESEKRVVKSDGNYLLLSTRLSEQHLLCKTVQDSTAAGFSSELSTNASFISQATNLARQVHQVCQSFSLEELMETNSNFDISTFLGEGSYGKLRPLSATIVKKKITREVTNLMSLRHFMFVSSP
ncbi:hypothetical protein TIFTF001_027818 [Ficus carica]|uniref:Protein kinase domain-containing protein n=1 Tax=Ficus carica TaxID=3494 RepID=A0AA88DNP5_FICCA|nr:hypothetical protein TIFTF001_027818 [Ficus carica]